jgi:DNA-binding CsgD family transcriptional regulator
MTTPTAALNTSNATATPLRAWTPTNDTAWLWQTFADHATFPVLVVSKSGIVEYANAPALALVAPGATTNRISIVDRPLSEFFGENHARERLEHIQQALATGRPIVMEELRRGRQLHCVMRPIPNGAMPPKSVLYCAYLSSTAAPAVNGFPVIRAKNNDAGKLGELTVREMEILRLIGLGLSTQDIAKQLGRSVKTIEWHRVSLGEKLGVVNRVELARIAIAAGLVGADEPAPVGVAAKN